MRSYIPSESRSFGVASPEEWIDDLSHLSRTLQNTDSLGNGLLTSAVGAVEKTAPDMLLWVQNSEYDETKRRVERRVQKALESICSLSRMVDEDSENMSHLMIRVLNVADHLLECHKCIRDQRIDRAAFGCGA
jgi:ABC-type branched-subunit amino acid transport system ATPase component